MNQSVLNEVLCPWRPLLVAFSTVDFTPVARGSYKEIGAPLTKAAHLPREGCRIVFRIVIVSPDQTPRQWILAWVESIL